MSSVGNEWREPDPQDVLSTQKAVERAAAGGYVSGNNALRLTEQGQQVLRRFVSHWRWVFPNTGAPIPDDQREAARFFIEHLTRGASHVSQEQFIAHLHNALMRGGVAETEVGRRFEDLKAIKVVTGTLRSFFIGARDLHLLLGVFILETGATLNLCTVENCLVTASR